jgi:predicted  nucleic acid-binding Zn-ribbon protein
MIERLQTLTQMQKLDDEIGRCRELQQILPQQLNELIEAVEEANAKVLEIEAVRAGIQKKQKELEDQTKHNLELMRKYGGQLADIKTNKEYKALNSEIANLKAKNGEFESSMLELMETDSEIKKQLAVEQAKQKAAENRKSDKEGDLKTQIAALEGKIEEIRNRRNDLARTLPVPLVKQYGALIKNKDNIAVAYNQNGACGGCGFIIRPQIRIELDLKKKIISCENCGRILMNRIVETVETEEEE